MARAHQQKSPSLAACALGLWFLALSTAQAQGASREVQVTEAKKCFVDAQAAYGRGELQKARDGFRCAYDISPSPELAWNLARVYERMGEVSESIRFYELCLAAGPRDASERKDIERRITNLRALGARQATRIRDVLPSQAELGEEARAFFKRGVKLYEQRRYAAALTAFTAALRASGAPELRYNLAVTAERLGQAQDALDHYRAYLAARPNAEDKVHVTERIDALRESLP